MSLFGQLLLTVVAPLATMGHPATVTHPGPVVRPVMVSGAQMLNKDQWRRLPYSGGYLYAHAVRMGWIRPQAGLPRIPGLQPEFTCSSAPCAFAPVKASAGSQPVDEVPLAASKVSKNIITGGNDYNCSAIQGYYESTDGGATWNRTCGQLINGGGDGDPILGFDLNNTAFRGGIDAFSNGTTGIIVDKSTDGGKTWSAPVQAVTEEFSGGLTDKPWMQIDTNKTSPHKNAIYISVTQFASNNNQDISVSHSYDGGATWKTVSTGNLGTYPVVNQFSDLAVGKDGTVYLSFMQCTANGTAGDCGGTKAKMMLSKSTDGGATWSKAVKIETVTLAPDTGCGFYGCVPNTSERLSDVPAMDIDNGTGVNHGTLYVTAYTYRNGFCQVVVVKSTNGGTTWSPQVKVAPPSDKHDQFFPWLSVSSAGAVGVTWMDRRNDTANISYEEFGAASIDGGVTYPNLQLSTVPSNPNNDGFGGSFMGDYSGNMWHQKQLYASWTDTSTGPPSSDFVGGLQIP